MRLKEWKYPASNRPAVIVNTNPSVVPILKPPVKGAKQTDVNVAVVTINNRTECLGFRRLKIKFHEEWKNAEATKIISALTYSY